MNFNLNFNIFRKTATNKLSVNSPNTGVNNNNVDSNSTSSSANANSTNNNNNNNNSSDTTIQAINLVNNGNSNMSNLIKKPSTATAVAAATTTTLVPLSLSPIQSQQQQHQASNPSNIIPNSPGISGNISPNLNNQNKFVLPSLNNHHITAKSSSSLSSQLSNNNNNTNSSNSSSTTPNVFSINKANVNNYKQSNDNIRTKLNDAKAFLDSEKSQLKLSIDPPMQLNQIGTASRPPILTPINNSHNSTNSASDSPLQFNRNRRDNLKPFNFSINSTPQNSSNNISSSLNSNNNGILSSSKGTLAQRFQLDFSIDDPKNSSGSCNNNQTLNHQLSLNLPSSSRSSSASSQTHSLSSSSSSLVTGGSNIPSGRLDSAVNSERYKEIKKNNGYLFIDDQRVKTNMDDLSPVCELGSGTCGHVIKMKHNLSGKFLAVKQMRISGVVEENRRIIMDLEVVLKCYDCPQIVKCLGYFISESDVWICMELMSMCFDKLLKKIKGPVPEPILGKLSVSTLTALNYLKENHNLIHRDVKPSNILFDENGNIKLCDFGISGNLINSNVLSRNTAGCAGYMAPERIDPVDPSNPVYDTRADIWSLGITLVELGTGQYPYENCNTEFEVMTTILTQDAPVLNGEEFSENFKSFVNQCLIKQVKDRPKYNVLMKHPFIQHYKNTEVDVKSWLKSVLESKITAKPTKQEMMCNFPGGLDIDKASLSSLDLNGDNNSSSTLSTPTVASVSVTSFN